MNLPTRPFGLVLAFAKTKEEPMRSFRLYRKPSIVRVEFLFPNNKRFGDFNGKMDYLRGEYDPKYDWILVSVKGYDTQEKMNEFREKLYSETGISAIYGINWLFWKKRKNLTKLCLGVLGEKKTSAQKAYEKAIENGGKIIWPK